MCTSILFETGDGNLLHGRTNEFGYYYNSDIMLFPRDHSITNCCFSETAVTCATAKYAYFAVNVGDVLGPKFKVSDFIQDGINEKGVTLSGHYYPSVAEYALVESITDDEINFLALFHMILGTCGSIEEVVELVNKYQGKIVMIEGFSAPGHLFVADGSGRNVVFEPDKPGYLTITEGDGVFTNSPNYKFHLLNLQNYANVQQIDMNEDSVFLLNGKPVASAGLTGGVGLPGDTSPASRFIRGNYYRNVLAKDMIKTTEEAVTQVFRVMNAFDLIPGAAVKKMPKGSVLADNAVPSGVPNAITGHTDHTVVKDCKNSRLYYKDCLNQTIRYVDMHDYDLNSSEILKIKMGTDKVDKFYKVKLK